MAGDFSSLDRDIPKQYEALVRQQELLEQGANSFASTMTSAFARSAISGRSFEDTLKSITMRLSAMSVTAAMKPISNAISGGLGQIFGGLFGDAAKLTAATGAIKPFAAGGVIGTPTYFPMSQGGVGLAGEAGPEAIMPLARGPDGRLGVASSNGNAPRITVNISTPDPGSFRRSEAYVTGQIARAVARGQRGL